jgi:hypothetical protein
VLLNEAIALLSGKENDLKIKNLKESMDSLRLDLISVDISAYQISLKSELEVLRQSLEQNTLVELSPDLNRLKSLEAENIQLRESLVHAKNELDVQSNQSKKSSEDQIDSVNSLSIREKDAKLIESQEEIRFIKNEIHLMEEKYRLNLLSRNQEIDSLRSQVADLTEAAKSATSPAKGTVTKPGAEVLEPEVVAELTRKLAKMESEWKSAESQRLDVVKQLADQQATMVLLNEEITRLKALEPYADANARLKHDSDTMRKELTDARAEASQSAALAQKFEANVSRLQSELTEQAVGHSKVLKESEASAAAKIAQLEQQYTLRLTECEKRLETEKEEMMDAMAQEVEVRIYPYH